LQGLVVGVFHDQSRNGSFSFNSFLPMPCASYRGAPPGFAPGGERSRQVWGSALDAPVGPGRRVSAPPPGPGAPLV
jgi:hypothetical protein